MCALRRPLFGTSGPHQKKVHTIYNARGMGCMGCYEPTFQPRPPTKPRHCCAGRYCKRRVIAPHRFDAIGAGCGCAPSECAVASH